METYRGNVEDYILCNREEAQRVVDEANQNIDGASANTRKPWTASIVARDKRIGMRTAARLGESRLSRTGIQRIVAAFCVFAAASMYPIAEAAEQLANPFGGQPPDYGPGIPDEEPIETLWERWEGNFLGYDRDIILDVERFRSGYDATITVNSKKGDVLCHYTFDSNYQGQATLEIPASIGGCWREYAPYRYQDLGGSWYGPISCLLDRSKKKGACTYTSTTGKTHRFSVQLSDS